MRRIANSILYILLAAALGLSLTACGALRPSEEEMEAEQPEVIVGQSSGQELVATYAADSVFSLNSVPDDSFNPYTTTSAWNRVVGMLVYENLVELDEDFSVIPNLITSWSTENGINWTFTVDTNRLFHDGGKMTAADAQYSIEQAMAYGGKYSARLSHVIGVSALDTETLAVTLNEANYRFYQLLNLPCIEYGTAYDDMPPGTGGYKFSESGTTLVLDRNHPLYGEMPLDTIYLKEYAAAEDILQAFEDSYLDLVINDPTGMASLGYSSTNIIKYIDTTSLHYIGYNAKSLVFGQSVFRVMMTYAVDRAAIVSDAMKGSAVAATMPVHPNSSLYPEALAKTLNHSETTFEQALRNMGAADLDGDGILELGGQKTTIRFLVCSDSAAKVSAARIIAGEMEKAGLSVELRELSYDDYLSELEDGNFDMYYAEVRLCTDWDLSRLLDADGALNYGELSDGMLEQYMQSYLASATEEELAQNGDMLWQYLAQNAPITPICFERSEVLYHRGVLSGLQPTQDDLFHGMENWTVTISQ